MDDEHGLFYRIGDQEERYNPLAYDQPSRGDTVVIDGVPHLCVGREFEMRENRAVMAPRRVVFVLEPQD